MGIIATMLTVATATIIAMLLTWICCILIVAMNRILDGNHSFLSVNDTIKAKTLVQTTMTTMTTTTMTTNMTLENDNNVLSKVLLRVANKNGFMHMSLSQRRLEFIHIPQPIGVKIEAAANQNGIKWGICHFLEPKMSFKKSMGGVTCLTTCK